MDRILLCNSKDHAYQLSKDLWEKESYTIMNRDPSGAERMFGIDENFLTAQFGLHVPEKYWDKLPEELNRIFVLRLRFGLMKRLLMVSLFLL